MVGFGLTTLGWAVAALPATVLIGLAFGGVGGCLATFFRDWRDFDYLNIVLFLMFLFSGSFGPVGAYPLPVRIVVEVLPFYHSVALVRGLTTGAPTTGLLWNVGYLGAVTVLGLALARHRMNKHLIT
jgi:lipooligosaccharide transport system permease protein